MLPGIVGSIQAMEVIKLILKKGKPLAGTLLVFDTLSSQFRRFTLQRNRDCAVCGDHPTVKDFIDYEKFCGICH